MIYKLIKKEKLIKNFKNLISFVKDRPGHDLRYALNTSVFKRKTNWSSKTSMVLGLKKTLDWYLTNNKWFNHTRKIYRGHRQGIND